MPQQEQCRTRGTLVHRQANAAADEALKTRAAIRANDARWEVVDAAGPPPEAPLTRDEAEARARVLREASGQPTSARLILDGARRRERQAATSRRRSSRRTAPAITFNRVESNGVASDVGTIVRRGTSRRRRDRAAPPPRSQPSGSDDDGEPGPCVASSRPFGLTGRGIRRRFWRFWRPWRVAPAGCAA